MDAGLLEGMTSQENLLSLQSLHSLFDMRPAKQTAQVAAAVQPEGPGY